MADTRQPSSFSATLSHDAQHRIEVFCAACHKLPDPQTFPKANWEGEVEQGFKFYIASGRTDLEEPSRAETVRYFRDRAPDSISVPIVPSTKSAHRFVNTPLPKDSIPTTPHCLADMRWFPGSSELIASNMMTGDISLFRPRSNWHHTLLGNVKNSCRVTPCDWNHDSHRDLLVCDIGSFPVGDHHRGKIEIWIGTEDGKYDRRKIDAELARVVEAQLIDFDLDGDSDILVAEFGWRETGSVKLLRNPGNATEPSPTAIADAIRFDVETLDKRHGALGVRVSDLNQDGRQDYVIAFAQEYETLEAYFGREGGGFDKQVLLELVDPSYNSSSYELCDIDRDGKLDILHTNGDTMDAFLPKPYHGVRWLRNVDNTKWESRELGMLVGALHACTADFDGDGDMDIAAVGMLPLETREYDGKYDSVVWWEQTENLEFRRHALAQFGSSHATCLATDIDGNGLPDLIVGNWHPSGSQAPFDVYLSQKPEPGPAQGSE
ncbi:MAG: VCBS repeat-containing protein [Pirellulales bacterium]